MKYLSVEVVICRQQQILNLTNQRSLFMTVRDIFEISDDDHPIEIITEHIEIIKDSFIISMDHPSLVTHACDI